MYIDIQSKELNLGQKFRHHLKVKIRKLFQRNTNSIIAVNVTLRDVNGPKGGEDKLCKINVVTGRGQSILVTARENNIYKAAALALKKANTRFVKQLNKSREFKSDKLQTLAYQEI